MGDFGIVIAGASPSAIGLVYRILTRPYSFFLWLRKPRYTIEFWKFQLEWALGVVQRLMLASAPYQMLKATSNCCHGQWTFMICILNFLLVNRINFSDWRDDKKSETTKISGPLHISFTEMSIGAWLGAQQGKEAYTEFVIICFCTNWRYCFLTGQKSWLCLQGSSYLTVQWSVARLS